MKSTLIKVSSFSMVLASLLTACNKSSGGFETDETTGVQYKFITHNEKGSKPSIGDFAMVKMIGRGVSTTNPDTILFNSTKIKDPRDTNGTFTINLMKSFNGCLEQGITLMSAGDSAIFKINADSLYMKTFRSRQLPKFIKPGSQITFYIKLVSFQTKEQLQQQHQAEMEKHQAEMEKRKAEEPASIAKYLADNHYTNIKPTKDSLFVLKTSGGNKNNPVKDGDSIYINYTGMLLDGTVFDASDAQHGHGALKMVYSPTMNLVKGWKEMIKTMYEGESAMILLPSSLGYGPQQAGPMILPYSPLVFELDLTKVKHNKPAAAPKK